MIIKEITISNYQCYFNDKKFEFTKGSNVVLGKNGGGKTKFFEAIEWLFDANKKSSDELISKKKLNETLPGKTFNVGVEIVILQGGHENTIRKYFTVKKSADKDFSSTPIVYEGEVENSKGEREIVDGQTYLNILFPPTNRKYCLFKGEAELNILKNKDALVQLIKMYTQVKYFGPYASKGKIFREYADKEIEDAVKRDRKIEKQYIQLETEINTLRRDLSNKETFLNQKTSERAKLEENINGVERHLANGEALEQIKKRIQSIEENIKKYESRIDEEYTTYLFDKNWFLIHFEEIQNEYSQKIRTLSEGKRKLQSEFDREKGIKEGEKRIKTALLKDIVPLPFDIPSKSIMEEMLNDQICKVCNREAKIGSEPYEFMQLRLKEYLEKQKPSDEKDEDKEELFKNNYTSKLVNIDTTIDNNLVKVRSIYQTIKEHLEFNQAMKENIQAEKIKREKEISDFENIIGGSELGQESLATAFKNSNVWKRDLTAVDIKINEYENAIKEIKGELTKLGLEKDKIDKKGASAYLTETRKILRDIEKIFNETKESKYDEFIHLLEAKANSFLKKINTGAFTGYIKIERKVHLNEETVDVKLMQDGEIFYHPNTSLQTSMHLAILFAISDMTKQEKEECYPIIFDAPTSSFDDIKRKFFFDVLGECNEQTILLTKDFTEEASDGSALLYSEKFRDIKRDKAILIKLEEPFDDENLATINTQIINL